MSGVELIVAALAAGAGAGVSDTASKVVQDGYAQLKRLLRPWMRGAARAALDADETEPGVWQTRLGGDLQESGAADDAEVLKVAERLLALADPARATSLNIEVGTNYGAVGRDFSGPLTFSQGASVPPRPPVAE